MELTRFSWANWSSSLQKTWRKTWRGFDGWLLFFPALLLGTGVLTIYSTRPTGEEWKAQLLTGILGIIWVLLLARFPYERLLRWQWVIFAGVCLLLGSVLFTGNSVKGAQRWIEVAGLQLQPSEFAKVGMIVVLAAFMHKYPVRVFPQIWGVLAVLAVPFGLVFKQPDLGTALVFGAIGLGMLYWGGAKLAWLLLLVSPLVSAILYSLWLPGWILWVIVAGILAWASLEWRLPSLIVALVLNLVSGGLGQTLWNLLKPYQQQRLLIFLDPGQDPLGSGYHIIQSEIAIGAGGLWGRGLFQGTQTQLNFIPEQHTDFIFSALGEEWGFIGGIVLLLCFLGLLCRLVIVANNARDDFGSLIAIGVFTMLLFQLVVNIGMTIGLAPVTGIPLPFITFGRSFLITCFTAIGLVESVAAYSRDKLVFPE
ncbi:MAG: rod shape-determining protein RodA [Gemmatimonadaceae bacterium]|nr:rod shape-determining protein RodA [Gloeobacterales cyanobacterium ES-bin-141]